MSIIAIEQTDLVHEIISLNPTAEYSEDIEPEEYRWYAIDSHKRLDIPADGVILQCGNAQWLGLIGSLP